MDNLGERTIVELEEGGSDRPVTTENRARYMHRVANFHLNQRTAAQCRAFLQGFRDLIDPSWLRLFSREELQIFLVSLAPKSMHIDKSLSSPTLKQINYRRTPLAPQLCFVMFIAISELSATVSHISRWSCQSLAWQSLSQYASPQRHSAVHCRPQ